MEQWEYAAWLGWILPILGALLTPILAKLGHKARDYGAILFTSAGAAATASLIPTLFKATEWPLHSYVKWIIIPGAPILEEVRAGVLVDPLSIIMGNIVAVIGLLIMIYSLGYMHGDPGLTRYWFFMNFFIGNMLLLVFSDNIIQMLFGWEGVGLCSYALIGFWYRDSKEDWLKCWVGEPPEAYPPTHSGLKAFLVTRFGDLLMLAGAFIILTLTGTLEFLELGPSIEKVATEFRWLLVPALLLLLGGPIGKSAQLPLMEWLPDAMAGPTSVSALIHAATMVKAGVYLTARFYIIVLQWAQLAPEVILYFSTIMWIGTLTALIAATQAVVSTELKKVLAYSTVSQLGYMMMALGAGGLAKEAVVGLAGGVFHMLNHALFKAALFLAAGSVLHAGGSRFLRDMGGLRRYMPVTFYSMLIAAFALMGVPPLSGFWSKDLVLEVALLSEQYLVYLLGVVTAALTAFYSVRMIGLVFFGKKSSFLHKREEEGYHIHEAPKVMWLPYMMLVIASIAVGILGPEIKYSIEEILKGLLEHGAELHSSEPTTVAEDVSAIVVPISSLMALGVGGLLSYVLYIKTTISPATIISKNRVLEVLRYFFLRRYYINALYYKAVVNPIIGGSRVLYRVIELAGIDRFNYLIADAVKTYSKSILDNIELGGIDRFNYVLAGNLKALSTHFRKVHTGILNHYVLGIVIGLFLLVLLSLLGGGL